MYFLINMDLFSIYSVHKTIKLKKVLYVILSKEDVLHV